MSERERESSDNRKRKLTKRLLSNIRTQQVVLDARFDLLRGRLQVLSDLETEPDFEHGSVTLADALEEGGAAALGAELAEDWEGAVCGRKGGVSTSKLGREGKE